MNIRRRLSKIFLLWNVHFGARPRVPPGCCEGKRLERGIQEAAKRLVNPVIRQVLMSCVKPTPDSIFGDVPDLDSRKAAELAVGREKWKSLRSSKRC